MNKVLITRWCVQVMVILLPLLYSCQIDPGITGEPALFNVSSDNTLISLSLSEGQIECKPKPFDLPCKTSVSNKTTKIEVIAVTKDKSAVLSVNGITGESGVPSAPIDLDPGKNIIYIDVTAEDGTPGRYLLEVLRENENNNTELSSMVVKGAVFTPAFNSSITSYSAVIDNNITSVGVVALAAAANEGATVKILTGGTQVEDPADIPMSEGTNKIDIIVSAPDLVTTKKYSLQISRMSVTVNVADLAVLSLDGLKLSPQFNTDDLNQSSFTADVGSDVNSIALNAVPVSNNATMVISINGTVVDNPQDIAINTGVNIITIDVTTGNGSKKRVYTVTVTRPQASTTTVNAKLAAINVAVGINGSMRPIYQKGFNPTDTGFSAEVTEYATVIWGFNKLTITVKAEDPNISALTIDGKGKPVDGVLSQEIELTQGIVHPLDIAVTASDGTTVVHYTLLARLLNIHEFYYGIYSPAQRASLDKWYEKVGEPDVGLNQTFKGAEGGTMQWTIKLQLMPMGGINRMDFKDYSDGGGGIVFIDHGWVQNGALEAFMTLEGNGVQEGELKMGMYGKNDVFGNLSYHLTIESKETAEGTDSYTDFTYMGETFRFFYKKAFVHESLADGWDPYVPWTANDEF